MRRPNPPKVPLDFSTPLISRVKGVVTKASYASASDLIKHAIPNDFMLGGASNATKWRRKLKESKNIEGRSANLYAGIASKGYSEDSPIELQYLRGMVHIMDGHHRIAVMSQLDPNKPLPLKWREDA